MADEIGKQKRYPSEGMITECQAIKTDKGLGLLVQACNPSFQEGKITGPQNQDQCGLKVTSKLAWGI